MVSLRTLGRVAGVALLLSGVVHLLAPRPLLRAAETGYRRVLAVDFDPRAGATRRVRLVGALFAAVGGAVLWVDRRVGDG